MADPIISAAEAQALNGKVCAKIDDRLFLCCNYEPTPFQGIGADGCFHAAVQDLYRFAVDSSCVIKRYEDYLDAAGKRSFMQIGQIINEIEMLRHTMDHNQSEQHGYFAAQYLAACEQWKIRVIGHADEPTMDDYVLMYQHLRKEAAQLLALLDRFITYVGEGAQRSMQIERWINHTLYWYCHNTRVDYYRGLLIDQYIARAERKRMGSSDGWMPRELQYKINRWILSALYADVDGKIDQWNYYLQLLERAAPDKAAAFCAELTKTIGKSLPELQREKQALQMRIGTNVRDARDWFYAHLEEQLQALRQEMDRAGEAYSLLPQGLLSQHVVQWFSSVSSPTNDF